jgi:hypothetical protein
MSSKRLSTHEKETEHQTANLGVKQGGSETSRPPPTSRREQGLRSRRLWKG